MTVYFGNEGSFDPRAMLTFGVSAKEGDNPIGYFGTGFKYAVAIILRNEGAIRVESGGEVYEFTGAEIDIRGEKFDLVHVNGEPAGFATNLGKNWEYWQAYRELYSNCIDEGGEVSEDPLEADTLIIVEAAEMDAVHASRGRYFLNESRKPIYENVDLQIFAHFSDSIYFRGIKVGTLKQPAYTYNMKRGVILTEDRTIANMGPVSVDIDAAWLNMSDEGLIREMMTSVSENGDIYEQCELINSGARAGKTFSKVCDELIESGTNLSSKAGVIAASHRSLEMKFKPVEPTRVQKKMLEKSIEFLAKLDITPADYEINMVTGLGRNVMGRAMDGQIYISELAFNQGTKQVASTLFEEWVHLKHDYRDESRMLQTWLFDKVLTVGEELLREPL